MKHPGTQPKRLIVAGIMSGTSGDGIDVAFALIAPRSAADSSPRVRLLGHRAFPFSKSVRAAVLQAMDGEPLHAADLARLHWRLGELYADAVEQTTDALRLRPALIGVHGQTIVHAAQPQLYLRRPVRGTWQIGEMSAVVERLRVPVVSDFRPADLIAGGDGAPLVPRLDYTLFASATASRLLLNLGGIANITAIPAGAGEQSVLAFDTGPANMVVDALMASLYGKSFDRGGRIARAGEVLPKALLWAIAHPFFQARPPKSCGREQFGQPFAAEFRRVCAAEAGSNADIVRTATELTVRTIADAYARFGWPHLGQCAPLARATELIVSGGGARNALLVERLRQQFEPLGVTLRVSNELGLPSEAKEALAFALLAWLTWHGLPGNLPSATGANRPVVLGRITGAEYGR